MKKLLEGQNKNYHFLIQNKNKIQNYFFQKIKQRKPQITTKFTHISKGNLAEHQYWIILNCECKHV